MTCTPGVLYHDSGADFVFPDHHHGEAYTPVDIPIRGCGLGGGLAMLPQGPAHVTIPIRTFGHPDSNFNWIDSGWWLTDDIEVRYESRDENFLYGVTKYPRKGKLDAGQEFTTGYYNANAYWTPPTPDPVPPEDVPPGGDPDAGYGQDTTTVNPPNHTVFISRPYHYADLKIYDLMGVNRTGLDLDPDPDHEGEFFDPADPGLHVLRFVYDDQDPEGSNLANFDWEPDADSTRNQEVALMSAYREGARGIRAIARNRGARKEIGVYSGWDSVGGSNVSDVSPDTVGGYASNEVEKYGRPPNFFKLYLHNEPAAGWPARGDGDDPAPDWHPQPFRDFGLGDRVLVRARMGFMDTGELVARITGFKISQADANNNLTVELDCVPHAGDLSEIDVVLTPTDTGDG